MRAVVRGWVQFCTCNTQLVVHVVMSLSKTLTIIYFLSNNASTDVRQMLSNGYRVSHVNIPHSSWAKIGDVFQSFAKELPYQEESSASGSDDN